MPKFTVQLIRDATDCLRTDIVVQARNPQEAGVLALEQYEAQPDQYEFRFWQCGEQGEVQIGEIAKLPEEVDPEADKKRQAVGATYEEVRQALNLLGKLVEHDTYYIQSNREALDWLRDRFAPEMDEE
jgi:hypothetical protein